MHIVQNLPAMYNNYLQDDWKGHLYAAERRVGLYIREEKSIFGLSFRSMQVEKNSWQTADQTCPECCY